MTRVLQTNPQRELPIMKVTSPVGETRTSSRLQGFMVFWTRVRLCDRYVLKASPISR